MVLGENINRTVAVPYWKQRTTREHPEMVQLRRRTLSLEKDMDNMVKMYERQEATVADLRAKLKQLRTDAAFANKQLELAHRSIERMSIERGSLAAGENTKRAYIKKLEARLAGMKSSAELHLLVASLQAEIDALRSSLRQAEARAEAAESDAAEAQVEAQLLHRGIELAAEQLVSSGHEVSTELLMAVASRQQQAEELASQLADTQGQTDEMAAALSAARSHLQAQHDALQQWQQWETSRAKEAAEREVALKRERKAAETLRRQVAAAEEAAAEADREREAASHRLELEKSAREELEDTSRALKAALRRQRQHTAALTATDAAAVAPPPPLSPLVRRSVEDSIMQLEEELARMCPSSAAAKQVKAAAAVGRVSRPASVALSPMGPSAGVGALTSPQRRIQAAGGRWHTNPLASPGRGGASPLQAAETKGAPTGSDAAWKVLERQMMMSWSGLENSAAVGAAAAAAAAAAKDGAFSAAHSLEYSPFAAAVAAETQRDGGMVERARSAAGGGLAIEVPAAQQSPGIASNRLLNPEGFTAGSADWLAGSIEGSLEELEAGASLHLRAPRSPAVRGAQEGGPAQQKGAQNGGIQLKKQSLFDLARMELSF